MQKNMVLVRDGYYTPLFKTGSDFDDIYVQSFLIDMYPVTNEDFKSFVLSNPEWSKENIKFVFADKDYLSHWDDFDFNVISSFPVVNVSWFVADAYCNFYGKRLPNIDEWEYISTNCYKDKYKYLQNVLDWYASRHSGNLISIASMEKNCFDVYGVYGVIWEWVQDFNSVIILNTDAEGGGLEDVLYCGAVAINSIDSSDYVAFMRYAFRNSLKAHYTINSLGFRCAKDIS
ncbi:MAG TPA: formylglycine-generating enzyme family protein [Candidatus Azoamicus sp. OHIO1]